MTTAMDSRTSSILLNLNLNLNLAAVSNSYTNSKDAIKKTISTKRGKSYKSLTSTIKECYLTGSLKYGNNFIM